jgi:hypothetical protein
MRLELATQNDFDAIIAFYDDVTERTPEMATYAHKIYERLGFEYRGKQHLYAENTGWTDFYFFELKQ